MALGLGRSDTKEIVQPVQCLPRKYEDPSLTPEPRETVKCTCTCHFSTREALAFPGQPV